jgi:chitinase
MRFNYKIYSLLPLAVIGLLVAYSLSYAVTVTLQWDPNTEPDLSGYKVYYQANSLITPIQRTDATEEPSSLDVGNQTSATISGLDPGSNYYFAVTAYNIFNLESLYSNVVTLPESIPPVISSFQIPSLSNSLEISITSFSASDNVGVTGYLITETSAYPAANNPGWSVTAPNSYTCTTVGSKTLYAWAKDAAGNISLPVLGQVSIDQTPPILTLNLVTSQTILPAQSLTGTISKPGSSVMVKIGSATPVAATVTGTDWAYCATNLALGSNTIAVTATDAASNNSKPESATITRYYAGAANSDGNISISDALLVLDYVLGLKTPTQEQFVRSDVAPIDMNTHLPQPDGKLDIDDVLVMLRRAVGLTW